MRSDGCMCICMRACVCIHVKAVAKAMEAAEAKMEE